MAFDFTRLLVVAGALSLSFGCATRTVSDISTGGVGGDGTGGVAGEGGSDGARKADTAGLWLGGSNGIQVCFFVRDDGRALTSSSECSFSAAGASSYDLEVEAIGRDENGEPCSFELSCAFDVAIDPATGAFGTTFAEEGTGAELGFSGTIVDFDASGVATRVEGGSTCTVAWAASRDAPCDDAAINACLDLQECCQAILVNPVFLQSCEDVAFECNERRCREVLAGYPRCAQLDL
jgi:hypothetical protein